MEKYAPLFLKVTQRPTNVPAENPEVFPEYLNSIILDQSEESSALYLSSILLLFLHKFIIYMTKTRMALSRY